MSHFDLKFKWEHMDLMGLKNNYETRYTYKNYEVTGIKNTVGLRISSFLEVDYKLLTLNKS